MADVKTFFDTVSDAYDTLIQVAIPRCQEILSLVGFYLPEDFQPRTILELGSGTGNLTRLLATRWPETPITTVDISAEMLQRTRSNLPSAQLTLLESSFESLELLDGQYDLIASSFAIHHLPDAEKIRLVGKMSRWLRPGGYLMWADAFCGADARLQQAHIRLYEQFARSQGALESQIAQWQAHREAHDHYASLDDCQVWLRAAGFESVDVLWRFSCFALLTGYRPK
jgi:tRNA (cmo5U34)-methyltransferase